MIFLAFNFNKCCIWIIILIALLRCIVWFNFNKCCIWILELIALHLLLFDLTLTSVVFEFFYSLCLLQKHIDLTLTSVVFEYGKDTEIPIGKYEFNFNKCCIWITRTMNDKIHQRNLTLTSVVFELVPKIW